MPKSQLQEKNEGQIETIETLLAARVPLIWTTTSEELRFLENLTKSKKIKSRETWFWSVTSGVVNKFNECKNGIVCSGQFDGTKVINNALDKIYDYKDGKDLVVIMRDMHVVMQDIVARRLRDMYNHLTETGKSILIVSPFISYAGGTGLHPLLEKQTVIVDFTLPSQSQIIEVAKERLGEAFYSNPDNAPTYDEENWRQIGRSLQGLSMYEIENALATSLVSIKALDAEKLMQEKKQLIKKNSILEYIETDIDEKDVGGLNLAKEYIARYGDATTKEAEEFGVEPLRGIILTGIAGTGKSLLAKAMGHLWKQPLVRLDIGKVMGKLVGSSEENMRSALASLHAASPIICWVDELEKAFSGTKSSGQTDGGTMSRVFGTLLTDMQEGAPGITYIATANNISELPPELLRRFNEIFFVDLPLEEERWEIFKIHLEKRKRDFKNFIGAKKELLTASEGFTGAEIEKAIKDGIASAFYNKAKDVKPADVIKALGETKPISKVQAEEIVKLQKWAVDHARFASSQSRDKHQKRKDAIKVDNLDLSDVTKDMNEMKTTTDKNKERLEEQPVGRFGNLDKNSN